MRAIKTLILILVGLGGVIAATSEWTSSATSTVSSHETDTKQSAVRNKQNPLFKYIESLRPGLTLPPPSGIRQEPSPEPTPVGVVRMPGDGINTSVVPEAGNMTYHGG